jgi:hypothetical protein
VEARSKVEAILTGETGGHADFLREPSVFSTPEERTVAKSLWT